MMITKNVNINPLIEYVYAHPQREPVYVNP